MTFDFVYITCADAEQAHRIGKALVEERLAACANILPEMRSLYWWEGAMQDSREAVLIAKCRREAFPAVARRVKELHTYMVPCVVALPVLEGSVEYLAWLERETRGVDAR
jgi:periplasmic divalent cation tolerance protein